MFLLYTCAIHIYIYVCMYVCMYVYTHVLVYVQVYSEFRILSVSETPQSRSPPLLALTAAASCAAQSLKLLKEVQSGRMEGIDNRRQVDVRSTSDRHGN